MKVPPKPLKGILIRHCKNCGQDFNSQKKSRYCRSCRLEKTQEAAKKYYLKNKEKKINQSLLWAKANIEKNREKARLSYHRRKHLELLKKRELGIEQEKKDQFIQSLKIENQNSHH